MLALVRPVFLGQYVSLGSRITKDVFELKSLMCLISVIVMRGQTPSPFKTGSTMSFLFCIPRLISRHIALFMDKCGRNRAERNDPKEQVTILTLLTSCISLHQPIDMGIVSTWKVVYHSLLIWQIVEDLEFRQESQENSAAFMQGMHVCAEGRDPHLFGAAKMV